MASSPVLSRNSRAHCTALIFNPVLFLYLSHTCACGDLNRLSKVPRARQSPGTTRFRQAHDQDMPKHVCGPWPRKIALHRLPVREQMTNKTGEYSVFLVVADSQRALNPDSANNTPFKVWCSRVAAVVLPAVPDANKESPRADRRVGLVINTSNYCDSHC